MKQRKNLLLFIFALFPIFINASLDKTHDDGDRNLGTCLSTITFNNKQLAESKSDNLYFFSIPLSQMNSDISLTIRFELKNADYTLKIDGNEVQNEDDFVFEGISASKEYTIEIFQGDQLLDKRQLIFTGLPIVQLYTNGNTWSPTFSQGQIRVHDSEGDLPYDLMNLEIRHRGASSLSYDKKSFAFKFKDENWKNLDKSYFGFRNDKYWILDAMAGDKSRMRNRVTMDLWNDFSASPYFISKEPNMINGTRGHYVEVFLDDAYWGLYCMSERIDRKQLKLKKYDEEKQSVKGVLYKATTWSYSIMMGYIPNQGVDPNRSVSPYGNKSLVWDGHEVKYPDLGNGELIDWKPLYETVSFVVKSDENDFSNQVAAKIDFPVWLDYYLMMEMILATDNHGKNTYLYMYDINKERKLGICPWDLDATFGRRWSRSLIGAEQDYTNYIIENEHGEHNLFRRLKMSDATEFNGLLRQRYNELRSTYFDIENIYARFEEYKNQFDISGAGNREHQRWNKYNNIELNLDDEVVYLKTWINDRVRYLDEQYNPYTTNINENKSDVDIIVYPNPVADKLYIRNLHHGTPLHIYTVNGVCIHSQIADSENIEINMHRYVAGCYYLKVGEKASKVIIKQ